jgi:hypothetical protein
VAELTQIETKLGEVLGLAQAAQDATRKVKTMAKKEKQTDLVQQLDQITQEAKETAQRCTQVAGTFKGKKSAITQEARETKQKATQMMETYLDDGADALDGFEFLTMAEAGETGHWKVLGEMSRSAGHRELQEIVEWVTPIQERHFAQALEGARTLAAQEDPNEPA